ncbi:MAG: hypothetical protein ACI4SF_07775, partial [Oscillospiraceae bacterium]
YKSLLNFYTMAYLCIYMITLYHHKVKAICRNMSIYIVLTDTHRTAEKSNKAKVKIRCPSVRTA